MSTQKGSTIQGANVSRSKNVPYFYFEISSCLTPAGRQLFETYSRLPASEVEVLYGFDCFAEYEKAGHELFRDADRLQGRFIAGDLFDESPDSALEKTAGSWDFHLKPPLVAEGEERTLFKQNLETFRRMWGGVGGDEGVRLSIEVEYDDQQDREARASEQREGGKQKFFSGSEQRRLFFHSYDRGGIHAGTFFNSETLLC